MRLNQQDSSQLNDISPNEICPYLGLKNDPSTSADYPSSINVCHHTLGKTTPKLNHQRSTCLTPKYLDCPIFSEPDAIRMPKKIRHGSTNNIFDRDFFFKASLVGITILVIAAAILFNQYWLPPVENFLIPSWKKTPQDASNVLLPTHTITATATRSGVLTPTQVYTKTPSPTLTPIATITHVPSILALDSPIGYEVQFIIHRAAPGESPGQYANQYNTTIEAIFAVNYNIPPVLFEDAVIVIPLDIDDASDLPAFEPYEIQAAGLTPATLAEKFSIDPEVLKLYNNIPTSYVFFPGEWVLIPHNDKRP